MKVNKNKFSFISLLCLAFFMAAGFFAGCSLFSDDSDNDSSETQFSQVSRLSFALASDSSRAILPQDVTENDISKVEFTVNASGSSEAVLTVEWASLSEMRQDTGRTLPAGTYDFLLSLYVGERVCQKASISGKAVVPGENRLEFDAKYVADGKGNFSLKLKWQKAARVSKVKASLLELDAITSVSGYSAEELALSDESEYSTALYAKSDVPCGTYFVKFVLYSADGTELNTLVDIIKIVSCLNTTSTATLSNINTAYKITYNLNGGSISGSYATSFNENTAVLLPDCEKVTKSDYDFAGWYTDSSFSGDALTQIALGTKNDVVLYAKWESIEDKVKSLTDKIKSLTESTTLVVTGEISTSAISEINSALKELKNKNSNVSVGLDLSHTTGRTYLEEASSTNSSKSFYGCTNLAQIILPDSVTSIGESAFYGCSNLKKVEYKGTLAQWLGITFGNSYANPCNYGAELYINGEKVTDTVIPDSVTSIGKTAFYGCSGLTSVTIGEGVTSIGVYAFYRCSGLTSVAIPSSVTSIGDSAFYGCSGLTSVEIPASMTSIKGAAFCECSGLTSVTIPSSVTSIGGSAFKGCTSLASIEIPGSVTSIGKSAFSGCSGLTSVTIGEGVTSIGDFAFSNCTRLASIEIPGSVTGIWDSAFSGCSGLTSVTIGEGVTNIGYYAFYGCSRLTSVAIPSSVTSIGSAAFYGCSRLTSVTIPDSVTSIINGAFKGCTSLASIIFNGTKTQWNSITKGTDWASGVPTTKVVCSDGEVSLE